MTPPSVPSDTVHDMLGCAKNRSVSRHRKRRNGYERDADRESAKQLYSVPSRFSRRVHSLDLPPRRQISQGVVDVRDDSAARTASGRRRRALEGPCRDRHRYGGPFPLGGRGRRRRKRLGGQRIEKVSSRNARLCGDDWVLRGGQISFRGVYVKTPPTTSTG